MKSNVTDIDVIFVHKTEKAVKVKPHETSPEEQNVWLPLSLVELEGPLARGCKVTVTGPIDLFTEKGLV